MELVPADLEFAATVSFISVYVAGIVTPHSGHGSILILVKYECGQTTSENGTYFVSPSTTNREVKYYCTGVG